MKKNRKLAFGLAVTGFAVALSVGLGTLTISADAAAPQKASVASFTMEKGASVRKNTEDPNFKHGIRFEAMIDADEYEALEKLDKENENISVSYGMLITPYQAANQYGLSAEDVFVNEKYYVSKAGETKPTDETRPTVVDMTSEVLGKKNATDTVYRLYGSLVNLDASILTGELVGRAYIAYTETTEVEGESTTVTTYYDATWYGNDMLNNTRSMTHVGQMAIEDNDADSTWLQQKYIDPVTNKATTYTVNYHKVNSMNDIETETNVVNGTIGDEITVQPKSYDGYKAEEKVSTEGVVYANGKRVFDLYYYTPNTIASGYTLSDLKVTASGIVWTSRLSILEDTPNVFKIDLPGGGSHYPMLTFTTQQDLSQMYALSYDIKIADVEGDVTSADELYYLPSIAGSKEANGDGYMYASKFLGSGGLSVADGWLTVTLTGLKGLSTANVVQNEDGTYSTSLMFIHRWNSAGGTTATVPAATMLISNVKFYTLGSALIRDDALATFTSSASSNASTTVDVYQDSQNKGVQITTTDTSTAYANFSITTSENLSNIKAVQYDIKVVSVGGNPNSTNRLVQLPHVPGGAQDAGDGRALSTKLIGKTLGTNDGWVTVSVTGLNGTSTVGKSGTTTTPIVDNGDGTYTIQFYYILRVASDEAGATITASTFYASIAIANVRFFTEPMVYQNCNKNTPWYSRVSQSFESGRGLIYNFRLPAGNDAMPVIAVTTTQNLSKLTGVSYDIKLTADTTAQSGQPTATDELYFLPNIPGSAQDRSDGFGLTSTILGQNGLKIDQDWKTVNITGLKGVQTNNNGSYLKDPITDNGDGTYTIYFYVLNRWNAASGGSNFNFNIHISNIQFTFAN